MHRQEDEMRNAAAKRVFPPPRTSTNDEAVLLLQDRKRSAADLNVLLQKALKDSKVATTYQAFRVRYLRALGKFRPAEYDEDDGKDDAISMDSVEATAVREKLQKLRQAEKIKKEHCSQLQNAWLLYDTLAADKPEVLTAEEEQLEKEMDQFEEELWEEWHDFAEDVIARADFEHDTSSDILDWHLELKEIRKDLKQIKRRNMERDDMRKRALRRIRNMVRAQRRADGMDASAHEHGENEDDENEDEQEADQDEEEEEEDDDVPDFHDKEPLEEEEANLTEDDTIFVDEEHSKKSAQPSKSSKKEKHKREKKADKLADVSENGDEQGDNSSESQLSKKSTPSGGKNGSGKSSNKKRSKKKKRDKSKKRNTRQEKLLGEVFPPHIAKALRQGRKVEPESKECVTVFFSDIVGFTNISSALSPLKVSDMLDRLYQKFDALSDQHDVYKVETIGDSWMGVTNLIKDQSDHAQRVANFALDTLKAANQTWVDEDDHSLGKLNLRVGFHSGPVVANVVGSRNPRYCLFGDTVNTASRMESHSLPGRIHCSHASARILQRGGAASAGLQLISRGMTDIKGKGFMETYFVCDETTPEASDSSFFKVPPISPQKINRKYAGKNSSEMNCRRPERHKSIDRMSLSHATALPQLELLYLEDSDEDTKPERVIRKQARV